MRIAIDTLYENPDLPTGSMDYLRSVVEGFPRLGSQHEYYALISSRNARHFSDCRYPNLHFLSCFRSNENMPLRILIQQSLMPYLMKRHKIDVLYAPGNVCPLWGTFCRVLKINTLHHYHAPQLIGRMRSAFRKFSFRKAAIRADYIVANTETTKREICQFMGVADRKVSVVAEPVYDVYAPVPRDLVRGVLSRYGLTTDYILFVSMLYPYKNVKTLIKSFARLVNHDKSKCELVIVGRDCDDQLSRLRLVAEEAGVAERVHFLGFVPTEDMPAMYSGARVFVFPSLVETFGKPLVEAMQCGVPVVASNTSCIPEVLGGAGLLVDPLNDAELASAIALAIEDGPVRERLILRGLERGREFSSEETLKQTLTLIEQVFQDWKTSQHQVQELMRMRRE
jgi:glycosyltransferase involved in cell wall biosynthesis